MNFPLFLLSHLLLILLFLILILASPSPSPDPYPAVVSLPARQRPVPRTATTLPASADHPVPPEVEHDLLSFVLVSTIDGALHAVDREDGAIRWSLKDGVDPLIGGGAVGSGSEEDYIVEPLSGSLYVFEEGDEAEDDSPKVRKLPLSVDKLIELSPFTFPHSPSRIFTGSKSSSLITMDLRTGQQLDCFTSFASNLSDYSACTCANENLLDDLERRTRSNRDVLFVGRTDYRLTIHTPPGASDISGGTAGERAQTGGVQEIMYSTYTPNSFDRPLADFWARMGKEEMYEEDGTLAKRLRVELGHDGVAVGVEQGGGVKWVTKLGNVGIAVYDILHPLSPASANPILVPQPPAHSSSLFPLPAEPRSPHLDILSKRPSTYIGTLPNLPSILPPPSARLPVAAQPQSSTRPLHYALSSSSYPLILFAPPPRPGSLTNGSFVLSEDLPERDQLLPYLLDPPADEKGIPPPDEERIDQRPPRDIKSSTKWRDWVIGYVGALGLCGLGLILWTRRHRERHAVSPSVEEKTPLLAIQEKERSVKFAEPALHEILDSEQTPSATPMGGSGSVAEIVEINETPKKKSTRRRVRGRKKPKNGTVGKEEEAEEDGDDSGSPSSKEDKPLPDLPRQMSAVDIRDEDDKEKLSISDCIIGYGSHGTVVLKGTWGHRPVAVKRLLADFTRLASQEVKLLQASDDHPNVIRYYCQERRDNFLYIALDLCQASLADLMESPDRYREMASVLDRKKAMREITKGVEHLHGMKIIHRDIKPQNVLVSQLKDGTLRMLVSDFGLARRLEHDQSSFAPTANNLAGSLGWRAPECIRGQVRLTEPFDRSSSGGTSSSTSSSSSLSDLLDPSGPHVSRNPQHRLTKAVDLFALGCLYFWILMSGQHPFGEVYDRESNIVKGDIVNMRSLDILGEEGVEAGEMIGRMLSVDPAQRPQTAECMTHPFFWTPAKRLAFLCDASDRFEIMELDPPEPPVIQLEAAAVEIVGKDWFSRADKVFTSNLGKYRKYKGNSVRDLLRAMRNKKHHYQDLEPSAKRHFGPLPTGFLHYFTSRYPRLFLHVYGVVKESRLRHESMFEGYFQAGD